MKIFSDLLWTYNNLNSIIWEFRVNAYLCEQNRWVTNYWLEHWDIGIEPANPTKTANEWHNNRNWKKEKNKKKIISKKDAVKINVNIKVISLELNVHWENIHCVSKIRLELGSGITSKNKVRIKVNSLFILKIIPILIQFIVFVPLFDSETFEIQYFQMKSVLNLKAFERFPY